MKLSQLKFFCTVVEHKTIAAAARELHCVPSNITLRLRELEESLGGELFSATRTGCTSIPKGGCSTSRRATLWRRRSAASSCSPASTNMGC
ncbi:LysR family transcriptional regulator [Serratia ureilytica]